MMSVAEREFATLPTHKELIMEAYCVKCKAKREMKNSKNVTTKNGRSMAKGTCPVCGTTMNKFLAKASGGEKKKK
jgi:hypothetical protein